MHYEAWCAADNDTYSKWMKKHENVIVKCVERMVEKGKEMGMQYVRNMVEEEEEENSESREEYENPSRNAASTSATSATSGSSSYGSSSFSSRNYNNDGD